MIISHYIAIVFIICFSMFVMIVAVQCNHFLSRSQSSNFSLLFFLLILLNVAECVAANINGGNPIWRIVHIIAKCTELTLTPVVPAVCLLILGSKKVPRLLTIPIGMNLILQMISLFSGIIFSVDAKNVYSRGSLYGVYVAIFLYCTVVFAVKCIEYTKRYQYQSMAFLSLIMMMTLLALISQILYSYLRLDWCCVSIAAILFYVYYDSLQQQIDSLTTLLNRRSYDAYVQRLDKAADILFLDVDHFKNVNDVYGHSFADKCLLEIAVALKDNFGKYGYCYRYGGDEFCVILTGGGRNTELLISKYYERLKNLRIEEKYTPEVSIGFARYNPEEETMQEAVIRADTMMYQCKNLHHNSK